MAVLGQGTYGRVIDLGNGTVAKVLPPTLTVSVVSEIGLLAALADLADEFNLVKMRSVSITSTEIRLTFPKYKVNLYEYSLNERSDAKRAWVAHNALTSCLKALALLHGNGILHRDVKPANLLMSSSHDVVLADLGSARLACGAKPEKILLHGKMIRTGNLQMTSGITTELYRACELDTGCYGAASDVYSLGVTILQVAMGCVLPNRFHSTAQFTKVWHPKRLPRLREVVFSMLHSDPAQRPVPATLLCISSIPVPRGITSSHGLSCGASYTLQAHAQRLCDDMTELRPDLPADQLHAAALNLCSKFFLRSTNTVVPCERSIIIATQGRIYRRGYMFCKE